MTRKHRLTLAMPRVGKKPTLGRSLVSYPLACGAVSLQVWSANCVVSNADMAYIDRCCKCERSALRGRTRPEGGRAGLTLCSKEILVGNAHDPVTSGGSFAKAFSASIPRASSVTPVSLYRAHTAMQPRAVYGASRGIFRTEACSEATEPLILNLSPKAPLAAIGGIRTLTQQSPPPSPAQFSTRLFTPWTWTLLCKPRWRAEHAEVLTLSVGPVTVGNADEMWIASCKQPAPILNLVWHLHCQMFTVCRVQSSLHALHAAPVPLSAVLTLLINPNRSERHPRSSIRVPCVGTHLGIAMNVSWHSLAHATDPEHQQTLDVPCLQCVYSVNSKRPHYMQRSSFHRHVQRSADVSTPCVVVGSEVVNKLTSGSSPVETEARLRVAFSSANERVSELFTSIRTRLRDLQGLLAVLPNVFTKQVSLNPLEALLDRRLDRRQCNLQSLSNSKRLRRLAITLGAN